MGRRRPGPLRPCGPPPHEWGGEGRGPSGPDKWGGEPFSDQLGVAVEDIAQLARRFDSMLLHHVEEAEDVSHARERHALFARQVLNDLHLADVALRVAAAIGARAVRLDESRVLIQHQRARVRLQDLGGDADRVQRLVEVAEGLVLQARPVGVHDFHRSELMTWMMAGPRRTIHRTGKMQPTIGNTIREDACAARSWAFCRWRRRISVACRRSSLAIGTPIWSDCTIDSTR